MYTEHIKAYTQYVENSSVFVLHNTIIIYSAHSMFTVRDIYLMFEYDMPQVWILALMWSMGPVV